MPKAGGTYVFLREALRPRAAGASLMSFLFVWQTLIRLRSLSRQRPSVFSDYATYI